VPSVCVTPFKIPRVRATLLDACGVPVEGICSSVSTKGIITVEMTKELQERNDFFAENGDGEFCVRVTDPPKLKWINLTLTFCNVDPELVNIMTAEPLVMSDATVPAAIGNRTREGSVALANFALEGWTRVAGTNACEGSQVAYLYNLWPWIVEGMVGDRTYENGSATFTVTGRTSANSGWGSGPYYVYSSELPATLGDPEFLPDGPITDDDHHMWFRTFMAPPDDACGCTAIPLVLATPGELGLEVTVTFPAGSAVTNPVTINWGDATIVDYATGTTAVHTYVGAGTYLITLIPRNKSSQGYEVSVTV